MRLDIVLPGGQEIASSLADGEHTEVAAGENVILRATRISAGRLKLELWPAEAAADPHAGRRERVRLVR